VTIFARLLSPLTAHRAVRRLILASGLAATLGALLLQAAPAGAVVTNVGGTPTGVQPRISNAYLGERKPLTYANPAGNPVLHGTGIYAIYWDPTDEYWSEWQKATDTYLQNVGAASGNLHSIFAVDTQYADKSNRPASYAQTFKGAYTDTHAYPASGCEDPEPFAMEDRIPDEFGGAPTAVCLTSAQMAAALEAFVSQHSLPKGLGNVYYLLTPPGVTVCLDAGKVTGHCSDYEKLSAPSYDNSFCSYHADVNPGGLATGDGNTIVYAVIPWTAGGFGDNDLLAGSDQRPGWECQDGGTNPAGKHGYELEKEKEENEAEKTEFAKKDKEEKEPIELAHKLEGPHEEEPNQQPCPSTAGTCDYGLFDLITNQLGVEQQNIVTDPLLNAWHDEHGYENSDECRFLFGPVLGGTVGASEETLAGSLYDQTLAGGNYYLNDAFNLAATRLPYPGAGCINGVNLDPKFTAPNVVNSGEIVGFDGMESDITLDAGLTYPGGGAPQATYATYTWNLGDGSPQVSGFAPGAPSCETPWLSPCAASVFHSYQYGGTYDVTLTVRDVGGNTATVTHEVTVDGPSPPSPGASSGSSGGGAGGSGQSSPAPAAAGSPGVPAPVASAAIISRTLKNAISKGLVIRYSVNEQVAGHFEVLLLRSVARRLGITGSPATGLPAGSPPELVIAKAILVTTKGGGSTVHIQFSKRTAARLSHAHKVSLMLRLVVRNASSTSPVTTTVVSGITLAA
jgi:hypothetical protein